MVGKENWSTPEPASSFYDRHTEASEIDGGHMMKGLSRDAKDAEL